MDCIIDHKPVGTQTLRARAHTQRPEIHLFK
jgi:hypothetical protein